MPIKQFRRKDIKIAAIEYTGTNFEECRSLYEIKGEVLELRSDRSFSFAIDARLTYRSYCFEGDWFVKDGIVGTPISYHAMSSNIFKSMFEEMPDNESEGKS